MQRAHPARQLARRIWVRRTAARVDPGARRRVGRAGAGRTRCAVGRRRPRSSRRARVDRYSVRQAGGFRPGARSPEYMGGVTLVALPYRWPMPTVTDIELERLRSLPCWRAAQLPRRPRTTRQRRLRHLHESRRRRDRSRGSPSSCAELGAQVSHRRTTSRSATRSSAVLEGGGEKRPCPVDRPSRHRLRRRHGGRAALSPRATAGHTARVSTT